MSNPNIVSVTTIQGKTAAQLASGSLAAIVTNSASSNKIYKVNAVLVTNTSTSATHNFTLDILKNASTSIKIANNIPIPTSTTFVAIDKNTSIYLEENDSLRIQGSSANFLNVITIYEEIS